MAVYFVSGCMVEDPCIGETDRVKRKLQRMRYWLYPFIFFRLIYRKEWQVLWTYPKLGEPRISVSLLYCAFFVCFISALIYLFYYSTILFF